MLGVAGVGAAKAAEGARPEGAPYHYPYGYDPFGALDRLIERSEDQEFDVEAKFNVGSHAMWAGTLRVTPCPNRADGPDRTVVFHAGGGQEPEDVLERLLADFAAWEHDQKLGPLPTIRFRRG